MESMFHKVPALKDYFQFNNLIGRSHGILWLFLLYHSVGRCQENLISNGDFRINTVYVYQRDTIEHYIPQLDDFSTVYIHDFKGLFCYPYPDSFVYIAFKIGNGFIRARNQWSYNKSEVYGKFNQLLTKGALYNFQFDYFPYWGNCRVRDSIPFNLLDRQGNVNQTMKVFFGHDTSFRVRTVEFNFLATGEEYFFCLKLDSNAKINLVRVPEFIDPLLKISNEDKKLPSKCGLPFPLDSVMVEEQMRRDKPFIYYMLNNFNCVRAEIDSSLICDVLTDSILVGTVYF